PFVRPELTKPISIKHSKEDVQRAFRGEDLMHGFLETWSKNSKKYPILREIDKHIKNSPEVYPDIFEPDNEYSLSQERFAYLGGKLGKFGLNNIPPELQKFFKGAFQSTISPRQ
ncbi:MAG: hypothetical protein Q8R29_02220, partial [bacterium]|nr:hypothetical protein [bacterium]